MPCGGAGVRGRAFEGGTSLGILRKLPRFSKIGFDPEQDPGFD